MYLLFKPKALTLPLTVVTLILMPCFWNNKLHISINKLHIFGFGGTILMWLASLLCNRFQSVGFHNFISHDYHVSSGIPQGSHLNLFINELPDTLKFSNVLLYADDAKIYKEILCSLDASKLRR